MSGSGSLDRCENGPRDCPSFVGAGVSSGSSCRFLGDRLWAEGAVTVGLCVFADVGCRADADARYRPATERRSESSAAAAPSTTRRWYAVADEGHFRGADRNGGDLENLGLGVSRDMERIAQRRCFSRCVCSGPGVGCVACQAANPI